MKSIAVYDHKNGRYMEGSPCEAGLIARFKWLFGPVRYIDAPPLMNTAMRQDDVPPVRTSCPDEDRGSGDGDGLLAGSNDSKASLPSHLLDALLAIHQQLLAVKKKRCALDERVSRLERVSAVLQRDLSEALEKAARRRDALDAITARVERIEKRLDILP